MKYLKLYENFNSNIEDTLEDIKWIMVELADIHKLFGHEKDFCMLYEISTKPSADDIESAKGRLEDLGYELVYLGTPAISARDIQGKQICWIVKSEFFRGPYLDNFNRDSLPTSNEQHKVIAALQKNILLEMWNEKPEIDDARIGALMVFNHIQISKVDEWFREFLGPTAENILHSLAKPGDRHRIQKGGYDFEITVEEIKITACSKYVDIRCEVLKGGDATLLTMSLEEAIENEDFGWEIKNEIRDCIEDYFYKDIGIRNKTGYRIEAVDLTFE